MSDSVGSRIKALRKAAGLTQKNLALKVDVEPATECNWENGYRTPSLEALLNIIEALKPYIGDQTLYLLLGESIKENSQPIVPDNSIEKRVFYRKAEEFFKSKIESKEIRIGSSFSEFMQNFRENVS